MSKPILLDLCCCAGGAGMGYYLAGFTVVGCDIEPQPYYPFTFYRMDAIEFLNKFHTQAQAVHGSPPCHKWSALAELHQDKEYPDLIGPIRNAIIETGLPYVIENVPKAPLINPIMLCGTMFGLQTKHGSQLRRHRIFEVPWMKDRTTPPCNHNDSSAIVVYGGGQHPARRRVPATIGVYGNSPGVSVRDGLQFFSSEDRQDAMGISWIRGKALSQAIPPAYTKFLGDRLRAHLEGRPC